MMEPQRKLTNFQSENIDAEATSSQNFNYNNLFIVFWVENLLLNLIYVWVIKRIGECCTTHNYFRILQVISFAKILFLQMNIFLLNIRNSVGRTSLFQMNDLWK